MIKRINKKKLQDELSSIILETIKKYDVDVFETIAWRVMYTTKKKQSIIIGEEY